MILIKLINLKNMIMNNKLLWILLLGLFLNNKEVVAQENIVINASMIDGFEITKQNILSYQILSNLNYSINADVNGTLFYRNTDLRMNYTFSMKIIPGINQIDANAIHITWTYSSTALRELFQDYNKLPAGTYQYCIKVTPKNVTGEHEMGNTTEECIYYKMDELFLINLIDPENDAKLYERNPSLSWIANYSFSSDLTYKLKIAEIKKGQNTVTAIARNNPMYLENGLKQNTIIYPMTAKPLQVNQPYAWTVDAFYKGILLGGAEPWKFTIVEDTVKEIIPKEVSYLDIINEKGGNKVWAIGKLKLKYQLLDLKSDTLKLELRNKNGVIEKLKTDKLFSIKGDNRYEIDFLEYPKLKHLGFYTLKITSMNGKEYSILFRYVNPEFLELNK